MRAERDARLSGGRGPPPWQFLVRAVAVVVGLTLLLVVDVRGAAFYVAWSLIGLALISEAAATLVHRHHVSRGGWAAQRFESDDGRRKPEEAAPTAE